jgi:hypothetical protein
MTSPLDIAAIPKVELHCHLDGVVDSAMLHLHIGLHAGDVIDEDVNVYIVFVRRRRLPL